MANLQFTLTLPETLAKRAQEAGLLSNERIAALLTMELRRSEAWERFETAATLVREVADPQMSMLSEEEVMQLVDEEIHLMRAEDDAREAIGNDTAS